MSRSVNSSNGAYLIRKFECSNCGAKFTKKALDKAAKGLRGYCPNCNKLIRGKI
jgi:DNA-directed RNA polymerase subunit RPC12/RpoP